MAILHVDFETRSACDLRAAGAYRYAADPSTRVLMMAWALGDDPVELWDAATGVPSAVDQHIRVGGTIAAHNAQFERLIFRDVLGYRLDPEQFICTAAVARAVNLPGKLDLCAFVLTGERKQSDGAALIRRFCIPRDDGSYTEPEEAPAEWTRMKSYCVRDVELERDIFQRLGPWDATTAADYAVCERMNDRGMGLDVPLAEAAARREVELQAAIRVDIAEATGGELTTPRGTGVARWVYARLPAGLQSTMTPEGTLSLATGVRSELLADGGLPPLVRRVVELAEAAGTSSVTKFRKATGRQVGGRLYGSFILNGGSTTGRYSAVGVQPQNLPRECPADHAATRAEILSGGGTLADLKSMLRPMLIPSRGHTFVCADLSQIEGRVLPWLANSDGGRSRLEIFGDPSRDLYCETASGILDRRITKADTAERQNYGKIPELALGFGGAVGALLNTSRAYGAEMGEDQARYIVRRWRATNRWAGDFWDALSKAARLAFYRPGEVFPAGRVSYRRIPSTDTLQCALPCGSLLNYHQVREDGDGLTGMHTRSVPKVGETEWPRVRMWHGILAENVTQATAARVQRRILWRLDKLGFFGVGQSHDEVLVEVPDDEVETAAVDIARVVTRNPTWAQDLPLDSEVWTGAYYSK